MCVYRKAIPSIGIQLHAISLRTIWSIVFPCLSICVIYKCQSGIDFFLLGSAQYNSNFMNKISAPVNILAENETAKWMRTTNVNKAMRFMSGTIKIRSASLILRKADNESKYVRHIRDGFIQ